MSYCAALAFFGDALAHAILPGVAIGYLVSGGARGAVFWWGLVTAVLTALGIGAIGSSAHLKEDTAIGILFAGMFALGIALISTARSYAVDLAHFMFGDVLGVSPSDSVVDRPRRRGSGSHRAGAVQRVPRHIL